MTVKDMMSQLKSETINTWFDLGLFLDRFKENRPVPSTTFHGKYKDYVESVAKNAMAICTFEYGTDGVSQEISKYTRVFKSIFKGVQIHYIGGKFSPKGEHLIPEDVKRFKPNGFESFDDWKLYKHFFFKKLERGGKKYNDLIIDFWKEVLYITETLGTYIDNENIKLLYLVNTNSNPGNISFALSAVFISEYLGIPVINNNHDFYWEGGHSKIEQKVKGFKPGPRDHFFKNYHLGEVFSIIEMLYPWESRSWLSLNINHRQCSNLINDEGHNPANVVQIGTAVDDKKYQFNRDKKRTNQIFKQLNSLFSHNKGHVSVQPISKLLATPEFNKDDLQPFITGVNGRTKYTIDSNSIILLQPTRIITRKRIEVTFTLLYKLFKDEEFYEFFDSNDDLNILLIISGPIATGHLDYFNEILKRYEKLIKDVDTSYRHKIFLGFLFHEFDKLTYKKRFKRPIGIGDLFSIAKLIVLPSETEGRGLPIIEAAACGIPIFCRRYQPEEVYSHVIGEHLRPELRLKNIDFKDPQLNKNIVESVKQYLFSPISFAINREHNRYVIEKRYSFEALTDELEHIIYKLYLQIQSNHKAMDRAKKAFRKYETHLENNKVYTKDIMNTSNRQYLAGYGQMAFMVFLKSLIDPSYFRVEEKRIRGMAMQFAEELVDGNSNPSPMPIEIKHKFYNSVVSLFHLREGEIPVRMDHSFAYRHRNKIKYSYREYTPQELTGVINILFEKHISSPAVINKMNSKTIHDDWQKNIFSLLNHSEIGINHIEDLEKKISSNIPLAYFPGRQIELELELFVLEPARLRLGLKRDEKITIRNITGRKLEPIYIIPKIEPLGRSVTAGVLKSHICYRKNEELKLLFEHEMCKIVGSKQHSVGIHFYEIGQKAIHTLKKIKDANGFIITLGDHDAMMTDIVDLERFHIGIVKHILTSEIMGIPIGNAYVQRVPAGQRFTLSYPTPVQDGKSFSQELQGLKYKRICSKYGEDKVLNILKKDAEKNGTPLTVLLNTLGKPKEKKTVISYTSLNGLYDDGLPWSGIMAKIRFSISDKSWRFNVVTATDRPKLVTEFMKEFVNSTKLNARVAWNGGYILNPELVGKLGIPERFIGSPLGLIISNGKVLSPPLYSKPAFLVNSNGRLEIKRVKCSKGLIITNDDSKITLGSEVYNLSEPNDDPCFYDMLYQNQAIPGNGRILVRMAGNIIKDIIATDKGQDIPVLPVGLTLSFPQNKFPISWKENTTLDIRMIGWPGYESAIEAGPQYLNNGKVCIDMEIEGWKTLNSIRTQAARLDYLDSRGPKIAIGLDKNSNLLIITINGRIRESVGATHHDIANIMKSQGISYAMGFDPGGSSTLVVDGKTLNISPYNHRYEENVYSLPPEPRAVANAVLLSEINGKE